jgi:hypothetical protein
MCHKTKVHLLRKMSANNTTTEIQAIVSIGLILIPSSSRKMRFFMWKTRERGRCVLLSLAQLIRTTEIFEAAVSSKSGSTLVWLRACALTAFATEVLAAILNDA